ncbi:MFS transporter [Parapedobacter lycopersici]|uniref:MFS transporter n=1 Tax=Parapedobacter lycopersici TaxID=1864939 RepID=UPI00214D7082|nr:MFS transporter [Parapedobacter lycopersici]
MTTPPIRIGRYRWTICALLFFATTVNYLDRQVLSLLHPMLEDEFGWSYTDYSNILAAFQLVYALSMLFAGRIVDRLGTKWGFAVSIVLWSVAAMLHALAIPVGEAGVAVLGIFGITGVSVSVVGFVIARALLGFGESGNFPAAIKATAEYFPKKERSFATGIFNSGTNVGAILAPLTVPWLALNWGWQSTFLIIGAVGFLWLGFWFTLYEKPARQRRLSAAERAYIQSDEQAMEVPADQEEVQAERVPWIRLLGYRQTWAFALGKFLTDGIWWFFLFWLPAYLKAQYGMEGTTIMLPLVVLYSMTMFGSIGGGWFPVYFMRKGYAPYDGRMRAMLVIALFPLVVLAAQPLGHISYWIPVVLIGIGASAHQAWSANIFTTVSDMFPNFTVGSVTGIGGMAGGMGGVVVSKLGGAVFDHYDALGKLETGYTIMFSICAVAYLVAWVVMKSLVPRMKLVRLSNRRSTS